MELILGGESSPQPSHLPSLHSHFWGLFGSLGSFQLPCLCTGTFGVFSTPMSVHRQFLGFFNPSACAQALSGSS